MNRITHSSMNHMSNSNTTAPPRSKNTWMRVFLAIVQTIAVLGSATLASVQPTPQMAREVAQSTELESGSWFAEVMASLTQFVQPLFGKAQTAQAVTTYGTPIPLLSTTYGATITTGRTGLCTILNCFITNAGNVVDANTTNVGNINIALGLLGGVYFSVKGNTTFPAGYRAGFLIDKGSGLIDLSLFNSFKLTTYLAGVQKETVSSAALFDVSLFGGPNANAVSFVTSQPFDEVRMETGSLIGALLNLDSYYAFVQQPSAPAITDPGTIWGIKNYTDLGYLNTVVSPWTWVSVTTLTGGNYNAAAAINRTKGIIFN